MDPFVRKLIERLHAEGHPLTRNKHFHTFETPEGKTALRISKRIKSLQRDVLASVESGHPPQTIPGPQEALTVELRLFLKRGKRSCHLAKEEFELLLELPGMKEAFP